MRQTARKYKIQVFVLNCLYIAYWFNKKDFSLYLTRSSLGKSVARSYRSKNVTRLIDFKLIEKIDHDIYIFTPLSCEILSYIDEQLTQK